MKKITHINKNKGIVKVKLTNSKLTQKNFIGFQICKNLDAMTLKHNQSKVGGQQLLQYMSKESQKNGCIIAKVYWVMNKILIGKKVMEDIMLTMLWYLLVMILIIGSLKIHGDQNGEKKDILELKWEILLMFAMNQDTLEIEFMQC